MEARDGDFARVSSPSALCVSRRNPQNDPELVPTARAAPPPRPLLAQQSTLESSQVSSEVEFFNGTPMSHDDFDDDLASEMPSPVHLRSQRRNGNGRVASADGEAARYTLQTIEYANVGPNHKHPRKSWAGGLFTLASRRTSETVRLSAVQDGPMDTARPSMETGVTITMETERSPAVLGVGFGGGGGGGHRDDARGFIKRGAKHPSYLHGSYRINSYFAIRLLRIMQFVVAIDVVALLFFYGYRRGKDYKDDGSLFVASPLAAIFSRGDSCAVTISLAAIIYHLLPAVIVLGLPASGFAMFEPFKREDRISRGGRIQKIKRTIFLQICEMTAVVIFFITAMMAAVAAYHLVVGELLSCTENPIVYAFGALAILVYALIFVEIRYFMRFREHLKMQLGAFSEADQTGDVKAHMARNKMKRRRVQEQIALAANPDKSGAAASARTPPRSQIIEFVRKRLYRGAQLGDIRLLKRTLRIAKNNLGPRFAKEMYPDAQLRLWFYSKSTKNPMHVAAYHGSIPAMELLFRANFSINSFDKISRFRFSTGDIFWYVARSFIQQPVMSAEDSYGASAVFKSTLITPLHCAVSTGRVDAVRWLLQHGADVNLCSRSSFRHESRLPPIFLADHPEIAKELLAAGANHLVIPDPGHMNTITVLQMAYLRGNYAVAQVLENWGGDVALTPLHTAAAMNNTARIRHYLRRKVDPDCLGELGYIGLNKRTPLHWACVNGAIDAVELLLGAKASADAQDARGRTPLHWAARVNQVEAVKVLLDQGADPNIVDDGGMTPIMCAACAGGTTAEMFKALVSHGANINHQLPSTGDTALHIAVKLDDLPTAVALLSVGGDIMRMNLEGLRPIDCTTSTRLQFEIKRAAGNRDVMISYTHSHKEFALKLRKTLEDANITTWLDLMDPSGIGGGAVWREEIARGVTNAAVVVCILTKDYAQSPWCMKELALAKQVGTPILAISTENAQISEELQVYLYTRQIIPFEPSITAVERVGEKDIEYSYDEEAYKKQVRMLLDGLRDEIEKRKEQVLRKNLSRAATASTMNASNNTMSTLNNSNLAGSGVRGRGMWNQGSATTVGGVAPFSNNTLQFDERTPAAMMQEKMMLESTSRDGFVVSTGAYAGFQSGLNMRRDRFDMNDSMLSAGSFIGGAGPDDVSFNGFRPNELTKSIVLNQNGYYVHQPSGELTPHGQRKPSVANSGSVLETFQAAKEIVDDGQQFVFICHADWHSSFVHRLCAALCREGGLHCYVGRRGRLGRSGSKLDENATPPTSGDTQASAQGGDGSGHGDEDMIGRIHEAKEAILKCSAFVLVMSEKTLRSQLVKDQLAFAEDKGKKIIPVVANPLEFSLDMQYSLSRSEFFHFFTGGDMIGFDKSLEQVLSALREEIYGISIERPSASLNRLPKSYSLNHLSSMRSHDGLGHASFGLTETNLRRRHGSNYSFSENGDAHSVASSTREWIETSSSVQANRSFIGSSNSLSGITTTTPSRPLNSDMSLQQAMLGNFSSLMRSITDELDDDEDDVGHVLDDDMLDDELDDMGHNTGLMRTISEPGMLQSGNGSFLSSEHELTGNGRSPARGMRPMLNPRPGRLSSIMSTSGKSVSILERESDDEATSIDGVRIKLDKSPVSRPV